MFYDLINLFYPAFCQVCGKKSSLWNENLCNNCSEKIKKRLPPFCLTCGRQLAGDCELQDKCCDCKKQNFYFDRAFSVFYYNGILKQLVHNFKYKKMTGLVKEFVELTVDFMNKYDIGKETDLVLSIPMHPIRFFCREINPSHVLAKNIAKKVNLEYSGSLLKKIKNTKAQTKLKRFERIENIKGSFSLRKNKKCNLRYKKILLVDDLFTTGSTVNECARILKEAGSSYIEVITLARGDSPLYR